MMCCIISDWTSKVCLSGVHKAKLSHFTFTNYFVHSDIITAIPFGQYEYWDYSRGGSKLK